MADAADPESTEVLYCLDLRPITCGLTWGRAQNGLVSSRLLTRRCEPHCPAGYHVVIVGGVPVFGAEGFDLQVQPGSVVAVEFVALPSPAGTPPMPVDHTPGSDSDSSSSDSDTSGEPDEAGSSRSRSPDASDRSVEMHAGTHPDPANVDTCSRIHLEGAAATGRLHATAAWSSRLKPGGGLATKILWLCLVAACGDAGTAVQLFSTATESRGRDPPVIAHHDTLVIPGATYVEGRDATIQPCCGRDRVRKAGRAARPVPTPCRTPAPVLEDDMRWHLAVLDTLLDECVAESDTWAFLAATLLETVQEHLHDLARGAQSVGDRPRSEHPIGGPTLNLDAHLSSTRHFDVSGVNLRLGCSLDDVLPHFRPNQWPLSRCFPDDMQLHPAAEVLRHLSAWQTHYSLPPIWEGLEVFTDGSFDGTISSWAFLVLGWAGGHVFVVGWDAGYVVTAPEAPLHIGATTHSAAKGELSALFWALVWLAQGPKGIPVQPWSDCVVALQQANGVFGASAQDHLARHTRAVFQVIQASGVDLGSVSHVRAHQGHPANECVDALAKWACRGRVCRGHPYQLPFAAAARDGSLDWWWFVISSVREPAYWPCHVGEDFLDRDRHADTEPPTVTESRAWLGLAPAENETVRGPGIKISVRAMTVNVQTLSQTLPQMPPPNLPHEGDGFVGRAAYLREQFRYHGVNVIALQETRTKAEETISSHSHIRLCSGCDDHGHHGVELWFDRQLAISSCDADPIRVQLSDLLVLFSDPRTLIVRFSRRGLQILFAAIHAPIAASPERAAWWQTLRERISRYSRGCWVVLLGDFNVHFGVVSAHRIGDLVWEATSSVPEGLHSILRQQDLWLPSTFSGCHSGPSETWIAPNGQHGSRIDFIAVPVSWYAGPGSSQVHHDLDWGQSHVDHFPVRLDVSFFTSFVWRAGGRLLSVDREAMETIEGRRSLQRIWESVPLQPWTLNVHRHWGAIEQHVSQALYKAFPSRRGSCRSSHFSAATWLLRQRRVWLRRRILRIRQAIHSLALRNGFRAWVSNCHIRVSRLTGVMHSVFWQLELQQVVAEMRRTKTDLRQAVRRDQGQRIDFAAHQAQQCPTSQVVSALRPLLGPPRRRQRGRQGLPLVLKQDGTPATSQEEAEDVWLQHFAGIEAGHVESPASLARKCMARQHNEVFFKYNYIQVDNTCYKDLQTLASGYKVEYVLYIFISPAIFFYLFYLFLSFFALF